MAETIATLVGEQANILLVDDTPENLRVLIEGLRDRGYRVRVAPGGEFALTAVAKQIPDLILLDINMPGMDGFEVCERLKASPATREIPVLFISAQSELEGKLRGFACGAVDFVTKPFQLDEVEARIGTHLRLRRALRDLERAHAQLQQLEQLRDTLTHMVVHDMRSPLTAAVAALEMIEPLVEADLKEDVELALDGCRRVVRLATELLDVSRLEAGEMPLHRAPCDLAAVVRDSVIEAKSMVPEKGIELESTGELVAEVDNDIIRRVMDNLIGNGLRYTESPLRVTLAQEEGGIRFSATDDGPGIPAELHERIFDKYGVAEARRTKAYHSVGLGLAFCKLAVEAHGGKIGVTSEVGLGSRFWFWIPL